MDRKTLKRLYVMGLLTHPILLFPLIGGLGVLAVSWLLGWPGAVFYAGLGAALLGLGVLAHGLTVGNERISRRALAELEQAARQEQAEEIERLRKQAAAGQELRTCRALMDLKALTGAFERPSGWPQALSARTAAGLSETVGEIIRQCLDSLRAALEIHETARKAGSKAVQEVLSARRDRLIGTVEQSIVRLSATLGEMQALDRKEQSAPQLSELGRELEMQLEAARQADRRMQSLGLEPPADETDV